MSEKMLSALMSAAASSAMEGLPLDDEKLNIVKSILNGETTLQEFFDSVKLKYQEN